MADDTTTLPVPAASAWPKFPRKKSGCALRKGECRSFVTVDRRPLDLANRIPRRVAVTHQVLVERRQRCQPPANRRRRRMLGLAHKTLPRDHRFVVGLAQFLGCGDIERAHEVLHVEPVGPLSPFALLLGSSGGCAIAPFCLSACRSDCGAPRSPRSRSAICTRTAAMTPCASRVSAAAATRWRSIPNGRADPRVSGGRGARG